MYQVINQTDELFPAQLKTIKPTVKILYAKGSTKLLKSEKCISIVGSRKISQYGREVLNKFIPALVRAKITVVSGFSNGVDALAHELTLQNGGETIAVMPCGIDYVYPREQKVLHEEIIKKDSLVISEYAGVFKTAKWSYVLRNRIVAALSPVTLVVEAGQNSGSLITARYAKLFSKKVCVITGSIFNEHIGGIIELLRQGAFPLQNIDELVNLYNWKAINSIQVEPNIEKSTNLILDFKQLSPMEQSILDLIVHGGENINALCRELKMDASKVLILLTEMQMKNVIYEKGGQYYANNA